MIYAIADMHGRFDLLCKALRVIEDHAIYSSAVHKIVIMGDFVDRGPQSRMIIDLLMMNGGLPAPFELIVLQGNHEAMMVQAIREVERNPGVMRWWIGNGGGHTLMSYGYSEGDNILPLKVPEKHLKWLENLPIFHETDKHIFVHGGIPHDKTPQETSTETLQWMLYGDNGYEDAIEGPDFPNVTGKHVVHGHHQSFNHPLKLEHRTNLDAWAYASGRLAIGVFDENAGGGPKEVLWATISNP